MSDENEVDATAKYLAEERQAQRDEKLKYEIAEAGGEITHGSQRRNRRLSSSEHGLRFDGCCSTCGSAFITRRANKMEVEVFCQQLRRQVPSDISECSSHFVPDTDMTKNLLFMVGRVMKAGTMLDPDKTDKERENEKKGYGQYL
jgi:hypothetical protein